MSLSADEVKALQEAMYVASKNAEEAGNETLVKALAQLNEMVLDGTYASWTNKAVIDSAIGRSPGYQAAWDALLRELKEAPVIGAPNPTPEPVPPPSSYPTPQVGDERQVRLGQPDTYNTISDPLHTQEVIVAHNVNRVAISNTNGASDQWKSGVRSNMVSDCNGDGGWRVWVNMHQTNSYFGPFETYRPSGQVAMDSASSFSYAYQQPAEKGKGQYSKVGSQTFVINGAGADSVDYEETENVSLMTMQGGRYMDFRTCETTNAPRTAMRLAPSGEDKVQIVVRGQLRTIKMRDDGTLYAE